MFKYIGVLQPTGWRDAPGVSDGFMLNGNSSLQSLARFYGLKPPAEPTMTVADYLAWSCYGQPRVGDRTVWERVQLVVQEMEDATISKVRLALLPLNDRREPRPRPQMDGGKRGAKDRRGAERRAGR